MSNRSKARRRKFSIPRVLRSSLTVTRSSPVEMTTGKYLLTIFFWAAVIWAVVYAAFSIGGVR